MVKVGTVLVFSIVIMAVNATRTTTCVPGGGSGVGDRVVDFSRLGKVDSSAVSLMLVWLREAQRNKVALRFIHVPDNLMSLAKLYGVAELLTLSTAE